MKTGTPQTSLNFKSLCGSSPATHPHKELVTPTSTPKGANGTGALTLKGAQETSVPGREELATLICCGTHSTTSRESPGTMERASHLLPGHQAGAKSPHNTGQAHWAW